MLPIKRPGRRRRCRECERRCWRWSGTCAQVKPQPLRLCQPPQARILRWQTSRPRLCACIAALSDGINGRSGLWCRLIPSSPVEVLARVSKRAL